MPPRNLCTRQLIQRQFHVIGLINGQVNIYTQNHMRTLLHIFLFCQHCAGGLVLCSKTRKTEQFLSQCFRQKIIIKRYRALCLGEIFPSEGIINSNIDGKDALTQYIVREVTTSSRFGALSTVDLFPVTGRRHQLRVHLRSIGIYILKKFGKCTN